MDMFALKRKIEELENYSSNGTTLISLGIRPCEKISDVLWKLTDQSSSASCVKQSSTRNSIINALESLKSCIKKYASVPENGLLLYFGEGKENGGMISYCFEPCTKLTSSFYICDNHFKTEILKSMLVVGPSYGFVVISGSNFYVVRISSTEKQVLENKSVSLPNKHRNGGQSSGRFSRIRTEKRDKYTNDCADKLQNLFISNDRQNVEGIFIGGTGELKFSLLKKIDPRIKIMLEPITSSHDGEVGFNEILNIIEPSLKNVSLMDERKILTKFFQILSSGSMDACYGFDDINYAFNEMKAVDYLIISEKADFHVLESEGNTLFGNFDNGKHIRDWVFENIDKCKMVTDRLQEGNQFLMGFAGIGAVLKYGVEFIRETKEALILDEDDFM